MTPTNGRHRRQMIVLLVATLALLGWLVWGMVSDLRSRPVDYKVQIIAPVNPYLCPGDQLRYPVVLEVRETPKVLQITEAWCGVGEAGVCDRASTVVYSVPVLRPRYVDTIAHRTMPDTPFFRAGDEIEYHHATTDGDRVTGYIVAPIVVRDNCGETPEGGAGGN